MGTEDLARQAGCNVRQLHHWCHKGYLGERHRLIGTGTPHDFGPADVKRARLLALASRLVRLRMDLLADRLAADPDLRRAVS